eukprot:CAMPEP_0179090460 /NCGR_PEP_ID=MMETSP0796-20121207/41272_1 /TAXON_ID=73915 /ORGANISM="Pyrodinium bahamense, Strain pbaha01" /LENGTH=518 /DNA_ID=CAMNT_0020788033 /DNA_START=23 /DNA_END=1579 /DNA_ORIENTATION=+
MKTIAVVPVEPSSTMELPPPKGRAPILPDNPFAAWHMPGGEVPVKGEEDNEVEEEYIAVPPTRRRSSLDTTVQGKGMFTFKDTEDIKRQVRNALLKPNPYNVANYYHTTGWAQWIARHSVFDNVTLVVIAFNAVWMWIDTDLNHADSLPDAHEVFQVAEHFFCFYFTLEWIVRFSAFKKKKSGLRDSWFVFDSLLVAMMVGETWILLAVTAIVDTGTGNPLGNTSILRLFRLLRLSRLLRMLRSLPELMILVKGMVTALKSVLYVICLLAIVTYVFAIAFTQLSMGTEMHDVYFDNVAMSMYSLLMHGTFLDDLSGFCNAVLLESPLCLVLVLAFISMACCTIMNMLIGVLCEVVSAVATVEKEERMTRTVSEKMQSIVSSLDTDGNNQITFEEFKHILEFPEALRALEEVGVDPVGVVDFAELFFFEEGQPIQQNFQDFMEMVLDLRGSNTATVKDVKHLWMETRNKFHAVNTNVQEVRCKVDRIEEQLVCVLTEVRNLTDHLNSIPNSCAQNVVMP